MKTKLKFYLTLVYLVLATLFVLPQVVLTVGDTKLTYPDITLEKIGLKSTWLQPKQSSKIFEDHIVTFEYQSEESSDTILETISQRAKKSGFYDVEIELKESPYKKELAFHFPAYYQDSQYIAKLLSARGDIEFSSFSIQGSISEDQIPLDDSDISTNFNRNFTNLFTPAGNYFLTTNINESKASTLQEAFTNTGGQFEILIDGVPRYIIAQKEQTQFEDTSIPTNEVRIFSSDLIATPEKQLIELSIFATYFDAQPLSIEIVNESSSTNNPIYVPNGASTLGIAFILAGLLASAYVGNKLGTRKGYKHLLIISTLGVSILATLKVVSANISVGTLLGMIISFLLCNILVYKFSELTEKIEEENFLNQVRKMSMVTTVLLFLLASYDSVLGTLTDAIGVLIVSVVVIFLGSITFFKYIKNHE